MSSAEIAEMMAGSGRRKMLDALFGGFPTNMRPGQDVTESAVIHWTIIGGPDGGSDTYETVIENGTCIVNSRPVREPVLVLTMNPETFLAVLSGATTLMMLFMTGKIKARGDFGLAANIGKTFNFSF